MKFRASDVGYDVREVGDRNATANEQLFTLPIAETGSLSIPNDYTIVSADHDLGFAPVFWCFGRLNDGTTVTMPDFALGRVYVDSSKIYYEPYVDTPGEIYFYLFDWPLTRSLSPTTIKGAQNSFVGGGGDAENRTSKAGNSVISANVVNENINTNHKNLLIDRVVTGVSSGPELVTINHNLGYRPFVFFYTKYHGDIFWESFDLPIGDVMVSLCRVTSTTVDFLNNSGLVDYTCVIFKDEGVK